MNQIQTWFQMNLVMRLKKKNCVFTVVRFWQRLGQKSRKLGPLHYHVYRYNNKSNKFNRPEINANWTSSSKNEKSTNILVWAKDAKKVKKRRKRTGRLIVHTYSQIWIKHVYTNLEKLKFYCLLIWIRIQVNGSETQLKLRNHTTENFNSANEIGDIINAIWISNWGQ